MTKFRLKKICVALIAMTLIGSMLLTGCGKSGTDTAAPAQNSEAQQTEPAGTNEPEPAASTEPAAEPAASAEPAAEPATEPAGEGDDAGSTAKAATELVAEFAPNSDYDKYALVDYEVEDIAAQFVATVSAKADGSAYELHCNMDGEEQVIVLDKDLNIVSDLTGSMAYDAPLVVKKAIDAGIWNNIE